MSGLWTSPYIMQVTWASFFSFSSFIMQKHEQMQILLALIAKLSFLLLLCIPPSSQFLLIQSHNETNLFYINLLALF